MLLLSPGNVNDIAMAPAPIAAVGPIKRLIADKAYDANNLRQLLAGQGAKAVIPSTMSRRQPIPYSKAIYRQRNLIERMFSRLKDFRRIATRRAASAVKSAPYALSRPARACSQSVLAER